VHDKFGLGRYSCLRDIEGNIKTLNNYNTNMSTKLTHESIHYSELHS